MLQCHCQMRTKFTTAMGLLRQGRGFPVDISQTNRTVRGPRQETPSAWDVGVGGHRGACALTAPEPHARWASICTKQNLTYEYLVLIFNNIFLQRNRQVITNQVENCSWFQELHASREKNNVSYIRNRRVFFNVCIHVLFCQMWNIFSPQKHSTSMYLHNAHEALK